MRVQMLVDGWRRGFEAVDKVSVMLDDGSLSAELEDGMLVVKRHVTDPATKVVTVEVVYSEILDQTAEGR